MTAAELAALYARRAARVEREFGRTAAQVRNDAQAFVDEALTRGVYAKPEDVSSTGRPKWRRTNLLAHSERANVADPYTVTVINTAPYAVTRHEAGKPGRRKINPYRISHWRDELVAAFRGRMNSYWQQTVQRILRVG